MTRSVLCAPVLNDDGDPMGVVQLINKVPKDDSETAVFTTGDESLVITFCGLLSDSLEVLGRVASGLEHVDSLSQAAAKLTSFLADINRRLDEISFSEDLEFVLTDLLGQLRKEVSAGYVSLHGANGGFVLGSDVEYSQTGIEALRVVGEAIALDQENTADFRAGLQLERANADEVLPSCAYVIRMSDSAGGGALVAFLEAGVEVSNPKHMKMMRFFAAQLEPGYEQLMKVTAAKRAQGIGSNRLSISVDGSLSAELSKVRFVCPGRYRSLTVMSSRAHTRPLHASTLSRKFPSFGKRRIC